MLGLQASSSSSNARQRRAAMSPLAMSTAALLLLRGASANSSIASSVPEYDNAIIESPPPLPPTTDIASPTLLRATARAARSLSTSTANTTQKTTRFVSNPPRSLGGEGASASVRLRLYWQSNYYWQETRAEKWWCIQCRDGACKSGSTIEIDRCGSSDRQKFRYYKGDQTYRPMTNPGLCFEENGWDSDSNPIKLKPCNGSSKQRWVGFNASKKPFEIFAGRNPNYLLTQAHHPTVHERVFPQQAGRARNHQTSKWVVF